MSDATTALASAPRACLITGVAGGIGRALARSFRASGYHVVGTDRQPLAAATEEVDHFVQADLAAAGADAAGAGRLAARIRDALGTRPLQALVHNAAVQRLGPTAELDHADWAGTLQVNLLAPFFLTQALLPELEATSGCVVHISSIHARLTKPGFVAYATSKAALSGMTRALAVDLAGRVRVNAIEPAAIATDMLRAGFAGRDDAFAALEACHPQGRIGTPEEVAALALALADGHLRFLHGACIAMDGGIGGRLHDPV